MTPSSRNACSSSPRSQKLSDPPPRRRGPRRTQAVQNRQEAESLLKQPTRAHGTGPTSSTRRHVILSDIRNTVIENFLSAVASDEATPPALTAELRELLAGTGKLPKAEQIVALVQTHTATRGASGGTA
jgi:hypothetical protein